MGLWLKSWGLTVPGKNLDDFLRIILFFSLFFSAAVQSQSVNIEQTVWGISGGSPTPTAIPTMDSTLDNTDAGEFTVDVYYGQTPDIGTSFTQVRVHYDSSVVEFVRESNVYSIPNVFVTPSPGSHFNPNRPETRDPAGGPDMDDGVAATDRVIFPGWAAITLGPNTLRPTPLRLFSATFNWVGTGASSTILALGFVNANTLDDDPVGLNVVVLAPSP